MQYNYPDLLIKIMFSGNKKIHIFFPDFGCMHRRMSVHAGFWTKLYTSSILLLAMRLQSVFFCLLLTETWICFNHNIV